MSDPGRLDLGDWALTVLAGIVVGVVSGLSAAMAWFRASKRELYGKFTKLEDSLTKRIDVMHIDHDRRYDKVEGEINDVWRMLNQHNVQFERLTISQENIDTKLEDLKKEGRDQNKKLDRLLQSGGGFQEH